MSPFLQVRGRGEAADDGGSGGDGRGDQVGPSTASLASLEVSVGRGGRPLTGLQGVRVHAKAHRATREAPFGAGVGEDLVETLLLGCRANLCRAWDDKHAYAL